MDPEPLTLHEWIILCVRSTSSPARKAPWQSAFLTALRCPRGSRAGT